MGKKKRAIQWLVDNLQPTVATAKMPARPVSPGLGEQLEAIFSGAENGLLSLFDDLAAMELKWRTSIVREYLNEDYVAANAYWYFVLATYDGSPPPDSFKWLSSISDAVLDYKREVSHKCASGKCAICKIRALLDVYEPLRQQKR